MTYQSWLASSQSKAVTTIGYGNFSLFTYTAVTLTPQKPLPPRISQSFHDIASPHQQSIHPPNTSLFLIVRSLSHHAYYSLDCSLSHSAWILCPPSQVSPASSVFHANTLPASTHTIFLYPSSGPKSAIDFALLSHGFQTTTSPNISRVISYRGLFFSATMMVLDGSKE